MPDGDVRRLGSRIATRQPTLGGNTETCGCALVAHHGHVTAGRITASGPRRERLAELESKYGIATTLDNREVARGAGLVVLSVKPQILDKVLREVGAELRSGTLVVSIAAGVDTEAIEET